MTSKTGKNTCQHLYKQGKKAGKRCGKGCRGKFCCDHKKKKQEYKAKYFQEKQDEKKNGELNDKIKEINLIENIDKLPNIFNLQQKNSNLRNEVDRLIKKKAGIRIYLGEDENEVIEETCDRIYGICKSNCDNIDKLKDELEEEIEKQKINIRNNITEDDINNEIKKWKTYRDNIIARYKQKFDPKNSNHYDILMAKTEKEIYLESKEKVYEMKLEESDVYEKNKKLENIDKCRRCTVKQSNTYLYFEYKGESKDTAKKKLIKINNKIEKIKDKRKKIILLIQAIEKRKQQLQEIRLIEKRKYQLQAIEKRNQKLQEIDERKQQLQDSQIEI
jgi:hypothetical protein